MDLTKGSSRGRKSNLIIQTWNRCKSIGRGGKKTPRLARSLTPKSKSWPRSMAVEDRTTESRPSKRRVAPEGCFSVYVGPEKRRFVIKAEFANHPLFKMLLEEAESEYGYNPEGPLALPCNVDVFYKVLLAMDDEIDERNQVGRRGCVGLIAKNGYGSYRLLSPSRIIDMNNIV